MKRAGGAAGVRPGSTARLEPPGEVFGALTRGFAEAADREPVRERRLLFAGRSARVRIAGDRVAALLFRPWERLVETLGRAPPHGLTVEVWSEAETNVPYRGYVPPADRVTLDAIRGSEDGRYVTYRRPHMVACLDRVGGRLVSWMAGPQRLALPDLGRPLKDPLMLWLRDQGLATLHAGLVARDGVGILFAGPGGAGKSTCTLACLEAGFEYVSDDFVAVERSASGAFVGHGLYASAHLEPGHLRRFPRLVRRAVNGRLPGEDKAYVPIGGEFARLLRPSATLRLLVLPRVREGVGVHALPISRGRALAGLAPSSLMQLRLGSRGRADELVRIAAAVAALRCHSLEIGGAVEEIPPVVDALCRAAEDAGGVGFAPRERRPEAPGLMAEERPGHMVREQGNGPACRHAEDTG